MEGKNFVLIGVNSDRTLERAHKAVKENELNWRSFQNKQDGGRISETWGVTGWPTVVVIGPNLEIVYRGHNGHEATKIAKELVEKSSKGE
jgi:hypothetical protein